MEPNSSWKVKIRDIGPGNDNLLLIGLIIRKQEPKIVNIKKDNSERCVWCFTLRDTPSDLINVQIWASTDYIKKLYCTFRVGDVVSCSNAKAIFRRIGDGDDLYHPAVTSSFYIVLNEHLSEIKLCTGPETEEYKVLVNIPSKPPGNFLTISDVHRNGEILQGQCINLLAGVQDIGEVRQFQSRDGRDCTCKEIRLIDQSYSPLFLTLWGLDMISLSDHWIAKKTVLFLADVRVQWSNFRKIMMISTSGRTIITENPQTTAGENLQSFMMSTVFQASAKIDQLVYKYADPSMINTITSCAGVLAKAKDQQHSNEFTALVYAAVNSFDIDDGDYFISTKCKSCNSKVDSNLELCLNADCPSGIGTESSNIDQIYDIRISLIDHTGMLMNCKLTNLMAQKMIGCKASAFLTLTDTEKTNLKWKYLLKYCAARLVIIPLPERKSPMVSIISIDLISLSEYSSQIPMC